jgi:uncharacterized protein YdcH (DUF465 family)
MSNRGGDTPVSTPTEAIRDQLMASDEKYQHLREEHARYAFQLEQLTSKAYLTEQEQIEEVRLKKLKLRVKDEMELLVRKAQTVS